MKSKLQKRKEILAELEEEIEGYFQSLDTDKAIILAKRAEQLCVIELKERKLWHTN